MNQQSLDQNAPLDACFSVATISPMTATAELDLKQRLSRLSERDRRSMSAYLLRLKHESAAGRKETTRIMRDMDAGKKTSLSEVVKKLGHA